VKEFASKTLPTLEDHLAEARRVHGEMGTSSGGHAAHRNDTSHR
jgi:hypothetical protein